MKTAIAFGGKMTKTNFPLSLLSLVIINFMEKQRGSFFNGLKRMIFKEEGAAVPEESPVSQAAPKENMPVQTFDATISGAENDDAAKRAYQLIESINQPGVDFFEVWNAVEENGGAQPGVLKQAFNTLKYADKTLTREKFLSSGNYYKNELQKALDGDIRKKNEEKVAIENKIEATGRSLSNEISTLEQKIKDLQKTIADKQTELASLNTHWQPKLQEIEQKMQTGRHAIEGVLSKMQALLETGEKEL